MRKIALGDPNRRSWEQIGPCFGDRLNASGLSLGHGPEVAKARNAWRGQATQKKNNRGRGSDCQTVFRECIPFIPEGNPLDRLRMMDDA